MEGGRDGGREGGRKGAILSVFTEIECVKFPLITFSPHPKKQLIIATTSYFSISPLYMISKFDC